MRKGNFKIINLGSSIEEKKLNRKLPCQVIRFQQSFSTVNLFKKHPPKFF